MRDQIAVGAAQHQMWPMPPSGDMRKVVHDDDGDDGDRVSG
jgi:hypothetical protein